ncbi:MAG: DNA-directed RNA polymerase subunit delta [Bacillota bacterium]|jgi:DNA-directed RNA polymerase subunit delta
MRGDREINLAKMSEVDLAYHILKQRGQPVYFRELIEEILRIKSVGPDNWSKAAAAIYTRLNLDTRFSYQGQGKWSLRAVGPGKMPRRIRLIKKTGSTIPGSGRRLRLSRRGEGLELGESPEVLDDEASSVDR